MVHFLSAQDPCLPDSFPIQKLEHLIVRKADEGDAPAGPLCKPAGNALLVGAELRAYGIKQINRTVDDVSHLFRAVVTLWLNHIADPAVQAHFRRLQGLRVSFFSSYFVFSMNKNAGQLA